MSNSAARWVLAFDSSCSVCRGTSSKVAHACDHKIDVLPLSDPKVVKWREEAFGANPPWAPTLLLVDDEKVQAWTGRIMSLHMVRAVGVPSTMRMLRVLSQLSRADDQAPAEEASHGQISRKHFLGQFAAGSAVVGGLLLFGRLPAIAAPAPSPEELWVKENLTRLPQNYSQLVDFDVAHRKAIYGALPSHVRSELWLEQFERYEREHPGLTPEQRKVLEFAREIASQKSTFADLESVDDDLPASLARDLEHLRVSAIAAFGKADGRALFASLGPTDESAARAAGCGCSCKSDWCDSRCVCCANCSQCHCNCSNLCGTMFLSRCEGTCG